MLKISFFMGCIFFHFKFFVLDVFFLIIVSFFFNNSMHFVEHVSTFIILLPQFTTLYIWMYKKTYIWFSPFLFLVYMCICSVLILITSLFVFTRSFQIYSFYALQLLQNVYFFVIILKFNPLIKRAKSPNKYKNVMSTFHTNVLILNIKKLQHTHRR